MVYNNWIVPRFGPVPLLDQGKVQASQVVNSQSVSGLTTGEPGQLQHQYVNAGDSASLVNGSDTGW